MNVMIVLIFAGIVVAIATVITKTGKSIDNYDKKNLDAHVSMHHGRKNRHNK